MIDRKIRDERGVPLPQHLGGVNFTVVEQQRPYGFPADLPTKVLEVTVKQDPALASLPRKLGSPMEGSFIEPGASNRLVRAPGQEGPIALQDLAPSKDQVPQVFVVNNKAAAGAVVERVGRDVAATVYFREEDFRARTLPAPSRFGISFVKTAYQGVQPAHEGLSGSEEHKLRVSGLPHPTRRFLSILADIDPNTIRVVAAGASIKELDERSPGTNQPLFEQKVYVPEILKGYVRKFSARERLALGIATAEDVSGITQENEFVIRAKGNAEALAALFDSLCVIPGGTTTIFRTDGRIEQPAGAIRDHILAA